MTGKLIEKDGYFIAVINYKNSHNEYKRKQINTNLKVRGNKKEAEKFLKEQIALMESGQIETDNDKQNEIKPKDITNDTQLEYYQGEIKGNEVVVSPKEISLLAKYLVNGTHEKLNYRLLNMNKESTRLLLNLIGHDFVPENKVCAAQIMYL